MFLGVDSLKIVHPQKTNISILCPLKIDGWSRVDSFPKFEMLSAFLGGRIERSGPMVTWWPSTGAILLWHKITFDPVQVDVQRRGASALTLNHSLWPLDLCTEKKIWIFGDFWDLVFKYYIPFFKSSFLMDTKKNRWTAELWPDLTGEAVFRGADYSHLLCFLTAEILPNATSTLGTRDGRAAFNAKCFLSDLLPRGERQATHHHGLAPSVTNWIKQVSGWYSVLVLSDTFFLFRFQGGWCLDSDIGGWKPWWGRKVYAQGMGSEAISRTLRWVQTSTDVQVPRFFFSIFLYRWYGSNIPRPTTWDV